MTWYRGGACGRRCALRRLRVRRAEVAAQLVAYIRERCDDTLWPAAAREVRALIAEHRANDAIAAYFANVGLRWDEERLTANAVA